MIIPVKRSLCCATVLLLLFSSMVIAQTTELVPAPTFRLLSSGYGAAALGMGGAFTAVADDLSAIYWNPAGVARINGMQFAVDYSFLGDSDEDFADEVLPNQFTSAQRFALKGNQFRQFSASYTFQKGSYRFSPFFAWQRTSLAAPRRDLKETAGFVTFLTPRVYLQSEGLFSEDIQGEEDEWAIGMAAQASPEVLIGGSLVFLAGNPENHLTGTFHESFVNDSGTRRSDVTADRLSKENLSGAYLRIGLLFFPNGPIRLGGTFRFPYERSSEITLERNDTRIEDGVTSRETQRATAESAVDVPLEWSAGIALQRSGAIAGASVTYADWSESVRKVTRSSDPLLIPETEVPYPSLRAQALQTSMLQYRIGTEYSNGRGTGVIIRAGYLWDGQPYGAKRKYFTGYSFGAGYAARSFRVDAAYAAESGDARLTSFSGDDSHITYRRFLLTVSFLSPN